MSYNPLLSLLCVTHKLPQCDQQSPPNLRWLLRPSDTAPTCFHHIFIFWQSRMFQVYLYAFLVSDLKSTFFFFLRSPGFLECKTVFLHATLVASTWKIPKMEESGGLQSVGHKESDTTQRLNNNKIPATQLLPFQITSL